MGQTLHTFTVLAHAPLIHTGSGRQRRHGHRGWGEKVVREWGRERGGGRSDTNMVFYLYVGIGKHRLKWLRRCFRGDTLSVIMTHRPASWHFLFFFFLRQVPHAHHVRTHTRARKQTHAHGRAAWQIHRKMRVQAHIQTNTHRLSQTTHTHTQRVSHLSCIVFAYWLCSIHHTMTGQSLLIRATSAPTEKSMVKYINKNTIKAIERRRGNKWPGGETPPASRGR